MENDEILAGNHFSDKAGNGQFVSALFIILIAYKIGRHLFEIYTLVSEIQDNTDHIFGVKNMFELEAELSCRHSNTQNKALLKLLCS